MNIKSASAKTSLAVATAAAALFALGAAPLTATAADGGVKCVGINGCKGQSECKTASNECKGMNSCKGHGWVSKASKDECTKAGGTVGM